MVPAGSSITAPGAAPREVPLLPGRTEVVAAPREQYRLVGDAGEIPANVRVLRVDDALVVTGLPDAQELSLEEFFRACRPGTDARPSLYLCPSPGLEVAMQRKYLWIVGLLAIVLVIALPIAFLATRPQATVAAAPQDLLGQRQPLHQFLRRPHAPLDTGHTERLDGRERGA